MKKNMGLADRIIRLLISLFLIDVAANSATSGVLVIVAWVVAAIMMITSISARCPLYSLLHIHTNKDTKLKSR